MANSPPSAPTLTSPANAATVITTTPVLNFNDTDPDGNTIQYHVQVDTTPAFNSQGGVTPFSGVYVSTFTMATGTLDVQGLSNDATYVFASMFDSPGQIVRINKLDFFTSTALTLAPNDAFAVSNDSSYIYAGMWTTPGQIVRISKTNFSTTTTLTLPTGATEIISMFNDSSFLYAGTQTSPGQVARINLSTFSAATVLTLSTGQNLTQALTQDSNASFIFAGVDTTPGQVVRIARKTFNTPTTLTLVTGATDVISLNADASYIYAGTQTSPGQVARILQTTFASATILTLPTNANNVVGIMADASYIYSGTEASPPQIIRINKSNFSTTSTYSAPSGFSLFGSMTIDSAYLYSGVFQSPGVVLRLGLYSPLIDASSAVNTVAFADITHGADLSPYPSGDSMSYTVQAGNALTVGTTYYWRIDATDPTGSNTYGAWSATDNFILNAVPSVPTLISPSNNATANTTTPLVEFTDTGPYSDGIQYNVQIDPSYQFNSGTAVASMANAYITTLSLASTTSQLYAFTSDPSYVYAGLHNSPGIVTRINKSDFITNTSLTFTGSANSIFSMASDPSYVYAGTSTSPGVVVRINKSTFSGATGFTLAANSTDVDGLTADTSYIYAGTANSPAAIVRIQSSTFSTTTTLTLPTNLNNAQCMVNDSSFVYVGIYTSPAVVVVLNKTTFTRNTSVSLIVGAANTQSIYQDSSYVYAGLGTSPGWVVRINKSNFSTTTTTTLPTGGNVVSGIGSDVSYLYAGTNTNPGYAVRINRSDFKTTSTWTLPATSTMDTLWVDSRMVYGGIQSAPAIAYMINPYNPLINAISGTNSGFADITSGHTADTSPFPSGDNITYTVQPSAPVVFQQNITTGASTVVLNSNQTAGNTNLVFIQDVTSGTFCTSVTDSAGNSYNAVYQNTFFEIWTASNIKATTSANTVTTTGNGGSNSVAALEVSGLAPSAPFDAAGQASGTATAVSASVTPGTANDFLVGFVSSAALKTYTFTVGSPSTNFQTIAGVNLNNQGGASEAGQISGSGAQTATFTISNTSQTWEALAAAFKVNTNYSPLTPGNTYYWRVDAVNPSGTNVYGSWSAIDDFILNSGPNQPILITPSNGGTVTSNLPALEFTDTNPYSDNLQYTIYIDPSPLFNSGGGVSNFANSVVTTFTLAGSGVTAENLVNVTNDASYVYAITNTLPNPGIAVRLNKSDFATNLIFTLATNISNGTSVANDASYVYIASGNSTPPPYTITRVNKTDFATNTVLTISTAGGFNINNLSTDASYVYAAGGQTGNGTNSGNLFIVNRSNFTVNTTLTYANFGLCVIADGSYIYTGIDTTPTRIVRLNISNLSTTATLTLPTGTGAPNILTVNTANDPTYLYVSMYTNPGIVHRINRQSFTSVAGLTLPTNTIDLEGMWQDPSYVYVGTTTEPAIVTRINLSDFATTSAMTLTNSFSGQVYTISGDGQYLYLGAEYFNYNGQTFNQASITRVAPYLPLISATSGANTGFADITSEDTADLSPFPSGDDVTYTVQPSGTLTYGNTYYWEVEAYDPTVGAYSIWSITDSFSVIAGARTPRFGFVNFGAPGLFCIAFLFMLAKLYGG